MKPHDADPPDREGADTVRIGVYSFTVNPDLSDNARLAQLKAYWDGKRGARPMPTRSEIDPLEMRHHLGSLVLIDVLPGRSDFRMRLIGTNIVQSYGRDSTGKLLSQISDDLDADYRRFVFALYRTVAKRAVVARARGRLQVVGREWRHFDSVLLPLDAGDGTVGMILAEQLISQ